MQVLAQVAVASDCGLFGSGTPTAYVCVANSTADSVHREYKIEFDAQQWQQYRASLWGTYKRYMLPDMLRSARQPPQQQHTETEQGEPEVDTSWLFALEQQAAAELQSKQQHQQHAQQAQGREPPTTPRPAAPDQTAMPVEFTPTLRKGKPVTCRDRGPQQVGTLKKLLADNRAEVKWQGQSGRSKHSLDKLAVRPFGPDQQVINPDQAGLRVVAVYGQYANQFGTVSKYCGTRCTVKWESGASSSVDSKHLHVLSTTSSSMRVAPTAACLQQRAPAASTAAEHAAAAQAAGAPAAALPATTDGAPEPAAPPAAAGAPEAADHPAVGATAADAEDAVAAELNTKQVGATQTATLACWFKPQQSRLYACWL